jgi:molecular chaperone GrpE
MDANANQTVEEAAEVVEQDLRDLQEQMQRLTEERDQAREQALRTMADFQNFRKRNQAEAALLRQFATENFVSELLPVLDNFERTVAHLDSGASLEAVLGGIKAVERQLRTVLESQNVRRIESVGQQFDPEIHEAIGMETSDQPENTVVVEVEAGYRMGEKVIRPARVKVAKAA